MRIAFAGTPEFAAVALRYLHARGHELVLVLTQPDRPAGRGLQPAPSAVKQFALSVALPLLQPQGLRLDGRFGADAAAARTALQAAAPDVIVVAAYGLILPPWVLALPRLGCINIHASLLPRWRGAAPIQRAIEAGDACTGISIMQMDEGLDTGAVLLSQALDIGPDDTAQGLHDKLAALGAESIDQTLRAAEAGTLRPRAQDPTGATYAAKIDKREAELDWVQPAVLLERRVRAFNPTPGTYFMLDGQRIKVWRAQAVPSITPGAHPGTVQAATAAGLRVTCGEGSLDLLELQRPGGRPVTVAQFLAVKDIGTGLVLAGPAG